MASAGERAIGLLRLGYLFLYAASGSFEPYLGIFFLSRGFSVSSVGLLTGLQPFLSTFSIPLWTSLADRRRAHASFALLSSASASALCLLVFACSSKSFLAALVSVVALALARAPLVPLIDAATMRSLEGSSARYGELRLWGGVGYAGMGFVTGVLMHTVGDWVLFLFFCSFSLAAGVCLNRVFALVPPAPQKPEPSTSVSVSPVTNGGSFARGVAVVLSRPGVGRFLLVVFALGLTHSVVNNMVPVFLSSSLKASGTMLGLSLVLAVCSEIPCFLMSRTLISKPEVGPSALITAAHLATIIRMSMYALAAASAEPGSLFGWMLMGSGQLLHGITFSWLWSSAVVIAHKLAPPGLETTAQGIISSVYVGLANGMASLVSGAVFQRAGPAALFAGTAMLALGSLVFFMSQNTKSLVVAADQDEEATL